MLALWWHRYCYTTHYYFYDYLGSFFNILSWKFDIIDFHVIQHITLTAKSDLEQKQSWNEYNLCINIFNVCFLFYIAGWMIYAQREQNVVGQEQPHM